MRREAIAFALAFTLACSGSALPGSIGLYARREPVSGRVIVVDVPAGSPGARAGVEVGDEVVAVDGMAVSSMSKEDFQRAVRGPVGSAVAIDVRRDGLLHRLRVERGPLRITGE